MDVRGILFVRRSLLDLRSFSEEGGEGGLTRNPGPPSLAKMRASAGEGGE